MTRETPNSNQPDNGRCVNRPEMGLPCINTGGGAHDQSYMAARSRHPGGVSALLCDGSVHFVTDGVDVQLWKDLSSQAGGEVASLP